MSEKSKKDISKWKAAIIGIGFVIGAVMLLFGGGGGKEAEVRGDDLFTYREEIEEELTRLCYEACGGRVQVFVSFEEGFSYGYALDSRGGVVTVGSGSSEKAVVESVAMPTVSGVGIVCIDGNCDENSLLQLVSSSLGIGMNKIFIINAKKNVGQS